MQDSLSSYVILDTNFRALRTYVCYANNSVGESSPCEIDVPGKFRTQGSGIVARGVFFLGNTSWWQQLDTDTIVLIVASVISIFICSTVLCIIIVLLCKKKGSSNKCKSAESFFSYFVDVFLNCRWQSNGIGGKRKVSVLLLL